MDSVHNLITVVDLVKLAAFVSPCPVACPLCSTVCLAFELLFQCFVMIRYAPTLFHQASDVSFMFYNGPRSFISGARHTIATATCPHWPLYHFVLCDGYQPLDVGSYPAELMLDVNQLNSSNPIRGAHALLERASARLQGKHSGAPLELVNQSCITDELTEAFSDNYEPVVAAIVALDFRFVFQLSWV